MEVMLWVNWTQELPTGKHDEDRQGLVQSPVQCGGAATRWGLWVGHEDDKTAFHWVCSHTASASAWMTSNSLEKQQGYDASYDPDCSSPSQAPQDLLFGPKIFDLVPSLQLSALHAILLCRLYQWILAQLHTLYQAVLLLLPPNPDTLQEECHQTEQASPQWGLY